MTVATCFAVEEGSATDRSVRQSRAPHKLSLGVSYEGRDPALLERMLPFVDYVEITPETISEVRGDEIRVSPEIAAELHALNGAVKLIAHGVSLSIGSHDEWSGTYFPLLDEIREQFDILWHSEHLGYTKVEGQHLGIMLAMPRTEESLDLVCDRINIIRARYDIPFLIENIVRVIPDPPAQYSDAAFLNTIADRTGCGILLDIYNLECDAHNHGLDIAAFLDELDCSHVREIHVACGVEHNGFLLDVHSRLPRPCTLDLAERALSDPQCAPDVMVYEFMPEAIPGLGHAQIADALAELRQRFCV